MTLHCLHGFLGLPQDWDELAQAVGDAVPALQAPGAIVRADLFGGEAFLDKLSIPAWAAEYYQRRVMPRSEASAPAGRFLLGYSLGGRLALFLARQAPHAWDGVIIVGANPGLDLENARRSRLAHDTNWARRFETEPWDSLVEAWNAQPVFANRPNTLPARREEDFSRPLLASALRRWSLGGQPPLWDVLPLLSCPLLWIAGADDTGQVPIVQRLQETTPGIEVWRCPGAAHRVPWEQPQAFAARIAEFITRTYATQTQQQGT